MNMEGLDEFGRDLIAAAKMLTELNGKQTHVAVLIFTTTDGSMDHAELLTTFGMNPKGVMQCAHTMFKMGEQELNAPAEPLN